jgi:hypothetical protein
MTPFSALFGGFCARVGSLCLTGDSWALTIAALPEAGNRQRAMKPKTSRPMCAAQARPARLLGDETAKPVRGQPFSPVSPEGDQFPRTRSMRFCVAPSCPAPAPHRQNAFWCIRCETGLL